MKFTSIFFTASAEIFEVCSNIRLFYVYNIALEEKYVARKIKIHTISKKKEVFCLV